MNHPVEDAASHVAQSGGFVTFAKLATGFSLSMADINAGLTFIGGLFTAIYGALKLWEWAQDQKRKRQDLRERDELRASERRTLEGLYRKVESWRTKPGRLAPAELTPEQRHATSPTPLWDDTYAPDQAHHEGKQQ